MKPVWTPCFQILAKTMIYALPVFAAVVSAVFVRRFSGRVDRWSVAAPAAGSAGCAGAVAGSAGSAAAAGSVAPPVAGSGKSAPADSGQRTSAVVVAVVVVVVAAAADHSAVKKWQAHEMI